MKHFSAQVWVKLISPAIALTIFGFNQLMHVPIIERALSTTPAKHGVS